MAAPPVVEVGLMHLRLRRELLELGHP